MKTETRKAIRNIRALAFRPGAFDRKLWDKLEKEIVNAGLCPSCATADEDKPFVSHLGKWEAGNAENYAGKECPNCNEFWRCGIDPEYDISPDCFSDADPGL